MNDSYYEQEPRASTSGSRVSRVAPMGMHGVPPGLAYLANQNSIVIKQQVELGESVLFHSNPSILHCIEYILSFEISRFNILKLKINYKSQSNRIVSDSWM
ncbi:unnamed protein product [Orchesella dallaii]|uniref:Uncharacterized protein n=1 Tax=Orchesella dallaii TaxID=48710 RepID=A0ABP1S6X1_9HEXA